MLFNNVVKKNLSGGVLTSRVQLKPLPFEIGALEPVISGHLMDFHYSKHHRTYVNNLNNLLEQQAEAQANNKFAASLALENNIRFNGGGHINHEFFWDSLCPKVDSAIPDSGPLNEAIISSFGTVDDFIKTFNVRTAAIQGSGWGWLVYNKRKGQLSFVTTHNQELLSDISPYLVPIINMDIWEHAYYLDYKNSRPMYLEKMWSIINWQKAEERLIAARVEMEAEQAAAAQV